MSLGVRSESVSTSRLESLSFVTLRLLALADATRAFEDRGIRWAALKGMDLAFRAYRSPEERAMCDIDVLVDEERFAEACNALDATGFRPTLDEAAHHRRFTWGVASGPGGEIVLELHRELFDPPHGLEVRTSALLDRVVTLRTSEEDVVRVLGPEDAWLHVAGHFAYSDVGGGEVERSVRELKLLGEACEIDPEALWIRAREWRVAEPIARALRVYRALGGDTLDPRLERFLRAKPVLSFRGWLAGRMLRRRVGRALRGRMSRVPATLVRSLLAPTPADALRMLRASATRRLSR